MTDYALVTSDQIIRFGVPPSARRLDNRAWVLGLPDASDALKAACGYLAVVTTPRPADTATETSDRSVQVINGVPTEVWTVRAKAADELNPPKSPDEKLAAAKATLAALDALPTPVLTADVVDLLDDLRSVL
jgi:hypothetical protein